MRTSALASVLASFSLLLSGDASDSFWTSICSVDPNIAHRPIRMARTRLANPLIQAAFAQAGNPCAPPSAFASLPEVSGSGGLLTVPLAIEQGTGINASTVLCFVYNGVPNPVIRLQQGQQLAVPMTNAIRNDDTTGTVSCAIQTFVENNGCAQPEAGFRARPGADGDFYSIEAAVPMISDGSANLHTHGFVTSPLPCHDEVNKSTLYAANWGAGCAISMTARARRTSLATPTNIPSDHPAGAYWYHAHRHGQEQPQQMMGGSGPIIIEGDQDQMRTAHGVADEVLMIRDIPSYIVAPPDMEATATPLAQRAAMNQKRSPGRLTGAVASGGTAGTSIDPRIDRANEVLCGSDDPDTGGPEETRLTLNRALVPEVAGGLPADAQILSKTMQAGERQVWRIINGSSQNTISPQLTLVANGTTAVLPLVIVAQDGVPVHDDDGTRHFAIRDTTKNPLLLPEAGRVEILVHAPPPGATLYLDSLQVASGCASDGQPTRRLLRVTSAGTGTAPPTDADIQPTGKETQFVNMLSIQPAVYRTVAFTEFPRSFTATMSGWIGTQPGPGDYDPDGTDFFVTPISSTDGVAKSLAIRPYHENGPPDVVVHLNGQPSVVEEWLVQNYTLEAHAFHIHQTHFHDITASADNSSPILDTVVVPPATRAPSSQADMDMPGVPGFVRLRMVFTEANIGTFVFHCHIGEHADNGMMQKISVVR